ncbi:vWA domain-containing protein [Acinetobacter schindleri]|uniref:vWA domain-containing protein n=1 Tax=Acinetobacter schindleri TaxID=108981 RepID=UPI00241CF923|nr:VWA domain-containing protein [Acinetobacter schindleri]
MKTKYKKITVIMHTAIMTSLICSALPSNASDIELYKAPQASETTLMFMLDVSGSMNPGSNNYNENRLKSLKDGMTTLLQGDSIQGIAPLPDELVVGLATFNDKTGRIKLEAKALGDPTPLAGNRPVYKTTINYKQDISRTLTVTKLDVQKQERTQTASSTCSGILCFIGLGTYVPSGAWRPDDLNTGWTDISNTSSSNPSETGWANVGQAKQEGNTIAQECVDWNTNLTCKTNSWVASSKLPADFPGTTTTSSNSTAIQGAVVNGNTTTTGPTAGSWTSAEIVSGSQICNSSGRTNR